MIEIKRIPSNYNELMILQVIGSFFLKFMIND
jgi:hypothetical protein